MDNSGVCHVTLPGDVVIKLRFGLPACRMFSEMVLTADPTFVEDNGITEIGIAKLLYFGYKNECIVSEVKQLLTLSDFIEYVESEVMSEDKAEMMDAINSFYNSRVTSKFMSAVNSVLDSKMPESDKKKLIGKKLKRSQSVSLDLHVNSLNSAPTGSLSSGKRATKEKRKRK